MRQVNPSMDRVEHPTTNVRQPASNAHPMGDHGTFDVEGSVPAVFRKSRRRVLASAAAATIALLAAASAWAAGLRADEQLLFVPSIGAPASQGGVWELDVHAWVLEQEPRPLALALFRKALGLDDDALTPAERATFKERARWFLVDNERGKPVSIWLDDRIYPLGKTEPDGRLLVRVSLPDEQVSRLRREAASAALPFTSVNSHGAGRAAHGEIHLLESSGLSVISDIDDTIKVSEVRDREALLLNTFVRPFKPVEGMAAAYRAWMTNDGAQFHYVSASPVQLYVPLSDFVRTNGFPGGTFHLKDFRWRDESFFNLFQSPEGYKLGAIEPVFQRLPKRRFVLVGDSGEKDPEIYGALARKFPQQVLRVLIRDVTAEGASSERYQAAFKGVPPGRWLIFGDAAGLPRSFK